MEYAVILNPADFNLMISEIKKEIREQFEKSRIANPDPPLSRKQIAKHLGISVQALDKRFKNGSYPTKLRHGNGRHKSFYASEFDKFLKGS